MNNPFPVSIIIFFLTVLPAFIQLIFGYSQSYGVLLVSSLVIFISILFNKLNFFPNHKNYCKPLLIFLLFIFVHSLLLFIFSDINVRRLSLSFIGLCLLLLSYGPIIQGLKYVSKLNIFNRIFNYIFYFYLLILFIAPIKLFTFQTSGKPVVFFDEISLFCLTFIPFLFYKSVVSSQKVKLLLIVTISILAVQYNSLLLTLMCIFVVTFTLKIRFLFFYFVILSLILYNDLILRDLFNNLYLYLNNFVSQLTVIFSKYLSFFEVSNIISSTDVTHQERNTLSFSNYFESRIPQKNNHNLSVLYLLSGWERAFINLHNSYGYGIGFQQLGFESNYGFYQDKLTSILGSSMGLKSGGSVGSKIISEFGIFGLFFIIIYIYKAFIILLKIRLMSIKRLKYSTTELLMMCIFTSYGFSLFLRGVGYFNTAGFLFIISFIWLILQKRNN
tara:strand:+ start:205 stop:1536 length:1332 start_codon:yes stop_codon:yes gene_type:complete